MTGGERMCERNSHPAVGEVDAASPDEVVGWLPPLTADDADDADQADLYPSSVYESEESSLRQE
jgi:hypothetical protein